ncbi:MAG: Fur family transcriptional regulator [Candidatus Saccharimonadales bacterium]
MAKPNQRAIDLYYKKLKAAKASNTAARSAVFAALYESDHEPLSMAKLITLTKAYADRASIYRSVHLLEEIGVIHRLHIGWKYKLELSDDFHGHHHHITCSQCGDTHATHDDETFEALLAQLAAKHGYTITDHQLDIKGICQSCQLKTTINK